MSLPIFPELPENYNFESTICQILTSIAMEEIGLSHILNAEGEKLQYILGTLPGVPAPNPTIEEVLEINESVKDMLQQVAFNQMFLSAKMTNALKAYIDNKKNGGGDPPEPPEEIKVEINGDYSEVTVGNGLVLKYIIEPEKYKDKAVWISSDPSIASVDNGVVTSHKLGTVVITLTAEGVSDSITVKVIANETKQKLPLKGNGPFEPIINVPDWDNTFSLMMKYDVINDDIRIADPGSIKLKNILNLNDFAGISVKPKESDLAQHFWIGTNEKEIDDAIIYDYYPPEQDWRDAQPSVPIFPITLILSKKDYEDTEIQVILRYDGSHFTAFP